MKQVQLSIPEPCHQDWNQMTPTQQGRHCSACVKQVIDFTTMSDAEVLNYFSNIKNEKVCGRAYPDQLERAITAPKEIKRKPFWQWHYITMLLLFFGKSNNAKAQNNGKEINKLQITDKPLIKINEQLVGTVGGVSVNNGFVINGQIRDIDENPIPFASIKIDGNKAGVSADANGVFSIRINSDKDKLEISGTGFYSALFSISGLNNQTFKLQKNKSAFVDGEIVITVGMISSDEMVPAENPRHVAVLK
ncbi:MAG: carboxypeptidase-like regulatory domain-containing protein [Ferruginibacter sp.]